MKRKLQVFVSSTFTDLKVERQAAVAAILKAGHIPAGMELFTSGDRSQMKVIEKWIDESDVYMLILGGRYGSIEKTSGVSYTELEYDYAKQVGKPMFAVVIEERAIEVKVNAGGTAMLERDNPGALKLFREKVLSNVSSFFSDEKDVRLCVHESLADLAENRDLKGWVSGSEVEDSRGLHDEVRRLREENERLRETLASVDKEGTKKPVEGFEDLKKILAATQVKIPANLTGGEEDSTASLLTLFVNNQDTLVSGVTNKYGAADDETFFYYSVCPKLQVHGLVDNEKVVGVQWRRSYVNKSGSDFLAYLHREKLLNTAPDTSTRVDGTKRDA